MSDQLTLAAETRDRVGKGASRALRRDGRVPAVIYGQNQAPLSVHLEEKALTRALATGHFMTTVVNVAGVRTLPKDVAFDVVTDRPLSRSEYFEVFLSTLRANGLVAVPAPL